MKTEPGSGDSALTKNVYTAPSEDKYKRVKTAEVETNTQAKIAKYFTIGFLFLVVLSILIPFAASFANPEISGQPLESAKDLIIVIAAVLAGPFGFITGFYFKEKEV